VAVIGSDIEAGLSHPDCGAIAGNA